MNTNLIIVYLHLGSNLGDREKNLLETEEKIKNNPHVRIMARSHIYESEPWGITGDVSWFLNYCLAIQTNLSPHLLLEFLEQIEKDLGRTNKGKLEPRTIDIDILLYGQEHISLRDLEIPHPRIGLRKFVLVPLLEIAPDAKEIG